MRGIRTLFVFAAAACALALALIGAGPAGNPFSAELARLEKLRAHARAGSAAQFKAESKIARIERKLAGQPGFDEPDQYARLLNEMRIPADRTEAEYDAGYRIRELDKALAAKRDGQTVLDWHQRGPGNVAGRARAIVVDPDDTTNRTWYIGTAGGGVWKTADAGLTWQPLTEGFPVLSVQSLAMAASNHNVMYAGTGESYYNVDTINGNGILKTTDRGQTWQHLPQTVENPSFNNVARIVVDPANANIVLAATTVGRYKDSVLQRSSIYKSYDGGLTWDEKLGITEIGTFGRVKKIQQIIAQPNDFSILYATVDEGGILKSVDSGESWNYVNNGITDFTGRFELAISPAVPTRLFAAAEGAVHAELWISTNAGGTWSRTVETGEEPNWLGAQGWYDNTIVCDPSNVNAVFVGGIHLWRIALSGTNRTSTPLEEGPVHVDHHGLTVLTDSPTAWRLLNTNDGGVGLSGSAGSNWTAPIDGMVTTQFYGVDKRPGASAYFGGMQDNGTWFSSLDPSALAPWTFAIGGDGYETSWHFDDPSRMIGGYQYNGLQRSVDGGLSWNSATLGLADVGSARAPFITKIAKSNRNPDFLCAVGSSGVWRSLDFGATWAVTHVPAATWGAISSFHDVKISRADPRIIWAGARMDDNGRIHVSTDGGATFTATTNYTGATMGGISGLTTHPTQPATAYVLFSFANRPKILRTTDAGATWTDITGFAAGGPSTNGFPDVAVYDLQVFSDNPDHLWAGTEIGLVESLDGGASWSLADNGLPRVAIWDLTEVEDEVVVGTHGRGIWSVKFPSLLAGKFYRPLIDGFYQSPSGQLAVDLNLRAAYDSTQVLVDGARVATLPANQPQHHATVNVPVISSGTRSVVARAFRHNLSLDSIARTTQVVALQEPVFAYENQFNLLDTDFVGDFYPSPYNGFASTALHSPHPYADNANYVALLTVPIRIARSDAYVEFDEVVIVEPGEAGSVYGDPDFWDYVIVEGTRDGVTWLPLVPGYDCRDETVWLNAWRSGSNGHGNMLRTRYFDLQDTFAWNETILLRFRLYSDASAHGWGWAIDNLIIQVGSPTDVSDDVPSSLLTLDQNTPNPFNPSTTIRYTLTKDTDVTLRIFDVRGRVVRTLVEGPQPAGTHAVEWDGRNGHGGASASGVYVYKLQVGGESQQRSMTLVR